MISEQVCRILIRQLVGGLKTALLLNATCYCLPNTKTFRFSFLNLQAFIRVFHEFDGVAVRIACPGLF